MSRFTSGRQLQKRQGLVNTSGWAEQQKKKKSDEWPMEWGKNWGIGAGITEKEIPAIRKKREGK